MRIALRQKNSKYQFTFHHDPKLVCVARGIDEVMIDERTYVIDDLSYMKIYGHILWDESDKNVSPAEKRNILENFLNDKV